jgi:hypothetical protein
MTAWWPLAAGHAYSAGCDDCGGEHLVVYELGHPYRPEWFSDVKFQAIQGAEMYHTDPSNSALTRTDGGAPRGNRTPNPLIKSQLLCQLS